MTYSSFISMLIYTSFIASITAGIILLIHFIFRKKIGASWKYNIWFLFLLKLSFPFAPESSLSIFNILKRINRVSIENAVSGISINKGLSGTAYSADTEDYIWSVKSQTHFNWSEIVFYIWLSVVFLLLVHMMLTNFRVVRFLRSKSNINNIEIVQLFENCKLKLGINRNISLSYLAGIQSPALYGVFKPQLILPIGIESKLELNQLEHVFLHELAHFKRKDISIRWALSIIQILYWFNPLNIIIFRRIRQDMEMACDAYALKNLQDGKNKEYASTIISFLEATSSLSGAASIAGIFGSRLQMKRRIMAITSYSKETRHGSLLKISLILILSLFIITNGTGTVNAFTKLAGVPSNYEKVTVNEFSRNYNGTFILYDFKKDKYYISNEKKAIERVSPCSTFKIVEALIGLQTGTLINENEILKWDKTIYPYEAWNQDQNLESAMKYSAEWFFQKVSSKVGYQNTKKFLDEIQYGNNDITGGLDEFWIESTLKISPLEQVDVLKKFYTGSMPFSDKNVDTVKKIIKLTGNNDYSLYGKTGSSLIDNIQGNGWFIGFIEQDGNTYLFSTYIQGDKQTNGDKAKSITLGILKEHFNLIKE